MGTRAQPTCLLGRHRKRRLGHRTAPLRRGAAVLPWLRGRPAVAGVGLGLAVPVNEPTRKIIGALMTEGRFRRAYLGLAGGSRPLPPRLAKELDRESGVEVVQVVEGSPADHAGLRAEDLIVALDRSPVEGVDDVQRLMVGDAIGARVSASVVRGGRLIEIDLVPV